MERNSERSFCCGAGGARMWMEEQIGTRINMNRTTEAVGTGADQIAVGCPFCRVMLSDGLTTLQSNGEAREEVEVLDVAQLLLASVKRPAAKAARSSRRPTRTGDAEATSDTPEPEPVAPRPRSRSLRPRREPEPVAATPDDRQRPAEPAARTVIEVALPAGVATVAETYAGRDVESILEGDDVDISEFKAALKEELKAEVLAEVKAELEGALNSPSGTSEPVRAEATSSAPAPTTAERQRLRRRRPSPRPPRTRPRRPRRRPPGPTSSTRRPSPRPPSTSPRPTTRAPTPR